MLFCFTYLRLFDDLCVCVCVCFPLRFFLLLARDSLPLLASPPHHIPLSSTLLPLFPPQISDCVRVLEKNRSLPADMAGKAKLIEWRQKMHQMGAAEELSEEQCRQLAFDLERTYEEFHRSLAKK